MCILFKIILPREKRKLEYIYHSIRFRNFQSRQFRQNTLFCEGGGGRWRGGGGGGRDWGGQVKKCFIYDNIFIYNSNFFYDNRSCKYQLIKGPN